MGFLDNFKNVFSKDGNDDSKEEFGDEKEKPIAEKGNFRYLDDLIHSGKREIELDSDIILDSLEEEEYSSGIEVDIEGIVIDGANHTIDARNIACIFIVSASVTLKNITFKNAKGINAGAITVENHSSLNCDNCRFEANSSSFHGGAIGIKESSSLKCTECSFEDNSSTYYGGAINNDYCEIAFERCSFKNNSSGDESLEEIQKLNESAFLRQNVMSTAKSGEGGAIHNSGGKAMFLDCIFQGNVAGHAGAISNHLCETTIEKCQFKANSSNRTDGGAIYNLGTLKIHDCSFEKNVAEINGGALANLNFFEMSDCIFRSNTSKQGSAGAILNNIEDNEMVKSDNSVIRSCTFEKNMAISSGAAIVNHTGSLTIENVLFEANTSNDAGVILNRGNMDLNECLLKGNTANGYFTIGIGGAIINTGNLNMNASKLTGNYAENSGGAIYDEGSSRITDCVFSANNVGRQEKCAINNIGGSLSLEGCDFIDEISQAIVNGCPLEVRACEFSDSSVILNESAVDVVEEEYDFLKAIIHGGNIHVIGLGAKAISFSELDEMIHGQNNEIILESDVILKDDEELSFENGIILDVDNITIDGNGHSINANAKSPIFKMTAEKVTLKNITFMQAYSPYNGSAVYAEKGSLILEGCNFYNNVSKWNGGAVYNLGAELCIDGCRFEGNNSMDDGGAVYISSGRTSIRNKSVFTDNASKEDGGAVYNMDCELTVEDSSFNSNVSSEDGGAIYNANGSLKLSDCSFNSNRAKDGGSIANECESLITIIGCRFFDDDADKIGGSLLNFGRGFEMYDCDFAGCSADMGGCIATLKGSFSIKNSCKFTGGFSKSKGGAIYNESMDFTIEDAVFQNSKSSDLGGAIYNEGSLILNDCEFNDNSSENEGGAVWNSYNLEVYKSRFNANDCAKSGSSIYHGGNEDSTLNVMNCQFEANSLSDGGAIHILEGSGYIESSLFGCSDEENVAINNSGGILEVYKSKFPNLKRAILNDHILYLNANEGIEMMVESGENAQPIRFAKNDSLPEDWPGFDYLNTLIQDGSDFIRLDRDISIHESEQKFYEGGIELDRDGIEIDGAGNVIDANHLSRIFYVTGRDITLKNIIFKNGKYFKNPLDGKNRGGGAICALHDSSLKIINCQFLDNSSRRSAGAIVNSGVINLIEDTSFENNDAQIYGGAIFNEGALNLNRTAFTSDGAIIDGGGIYNHKGSVSAHESQFKSCNANSGGAIDNMDGSLVIDGCEFIQCIAGWDGGAIHNYSGSAKIAGSVFTSNNADGGGNRYVYSALLENDSFEANTSIDGLKGYGGAITNWNGSVEFEDVSFVDNVSQSRASSIYANGGITNLDDCSFRGEHGDIILNESRMTFEACRFEDNHEITNRSVIRRSLENDGLNVKNERGHIHTIFKENHEGHMFFSDLERLIKHGSRKISLQSNFILSDSERNRYSEGIRIEADNLVIDGNGMVIDANGMSPIFLIMGHDITIKNVTFSNSFSNTHAALNNAGSLTLDDCRFINNSSNRDFGGAVYNVGRLDLEGCLFKSNGAIKRGGAIYNENGKMDVKNCIFEDNISREKGDAIYNSEGFLTLKDSKSIKNGLLNAETALYNQGNFIGQNFNEK